MEEPPVIPAEAPARPKGGLGWIGLCCSLLAVGALLMMVLLKPG